MTELRTREEIKHCVRVMASALTREHCGDWIFDDDIGAVAQASAMVSTLDWVLGHDNATFLAVLAKAERGLKALGVTVPKKETLR